MSTPALTIEDYYPTMFGTTWTHLAQQKVSRMRNLVTVDSNVVGQRKSYNQIGISDDEEITTRNGETTDMERLDEKRWVSLKPYHSVKWFDEWDDQLLGNIVKPTSETIRSMTMRFGRRVDKVVIDALGGTALTGEEGTTSTVLPSAQKIGVNEGATASNLNIEKLIQARSLLGVNEVVGHSIEESEPVYIVVSQSQIDALLRTTEVTSADFNTVKALQAGTINSFMGMTWIRSQQLPIDANNVRSCYVWVPTGITLSIGKDFTTMMDILPQRNHSLQVRSKYRLGATRMEEVRVAEIACDED